MFPNQLRNISRKLAKSCLPRDYAEQLGGLQDSISLRPPDQTACLPVLHYQEDFETIIRKIGTTARTAIEESGANYCT